MRSVVMKFVTADRSPDGTAASSSHRPRRPQPIEPVRAAEAASRAGTDTAALAAAGRDPLADEPGTGGQAADENRHPDRPDRALGGQTERRLDEERVGEQGGERPRVAQGVEPVRVGGLTVGRSDRGEPRAQQWRGRGDQQGRGADREDQDPDEVDDGRQPDVAQVADAGGGERQGRDSQQRQDHVDDGPTARPEARGRQVAIGVADEQDRLEEEQDGGPDRGRAAERRQRQPADQGLDREQQERRQGDRRREDRQDGRREADQRARGSARHGRLDAFGVGRHRPSGALGR